MLDIFNNQAFSMVALSAAINLVPNTYGRLRELNVFPIKPVNTTSVAIEIKNNVLNLIPTQPRGGPANQNVTGKRQLKSFRIPHIPLEDRILADEVQNIRAFGTESQLQAVMGLVNERQIEIVNKFAITLEWLRNGALKGEVLDADGVTVLYDWFTEFGIEQKSVNFALTTEGTNVPAKILEVKRHIEDNLLGDTMTRIHALCSPEFWEALTSHKSVIDAYQFYQGVNHQRDDLRKGWEYQGVFFEEYRGQAEDADGNVHKFVPANEARFFPEGTQNTFRTFVGPADFIETVNTMGLPLYSKLAIDQELQRWVKIHSQSNPLPICMRPAVLVKGTKTAG